MTLMRKTPLAVFLCALGGTGVALWAQQQTPLAITHVDVVDVAAGRVLPDMTVVIQDDRIVSVSKAIAAKVPTRTRTVDGRRRFLIPGLWDMHVHLSYARASALPTLVANGVTSVRDMGSQLSELDDWRTQIATGRLVGPQIVRAGPMLNGQQFNRYQVAVSSDAEARAAVRTLHNVGVDFVKVHRALSREAYFAVAQETKRLSLPFVGHIPNTVTSAEASDAGQATVEHTETLFEGTFAATNKGKNLALAIAEWRMTAASDLFARFVMNGTALTPTLIAQRQGLDWLESRTENDPRSKYVAASAKRETAQALEPLLPQATQFLVERRPLLSEFRAVVGLAQRSGVLLLAGTDLASSFLYPGFSLHDELAMMVESGLSPGEALRTATFNPARVFPKLAGAIEVGQRADLVLLDANPLENIRNTQMIRAVVLRGRIFDRKALDEMLVQASRLAQQN